jgi:hypothetical protein
MLYNRNGLEKPEGQKVRRNAPAFQKFTVEWDGVTRGHDLDPELKWHRNTKRWWQKWRTSPQSMVMIDSDWEVLEVTALVHDKLWWGIEHGKLTANAICMLASELRRREDQFGGSFEARLQMKMEIESPKDSVDEEQLVKKAADQLVDYTEMFTNEVSKREMFTKEIADGRTK